ncbi:MAG: 5-formyltetrahydrofolate cyclo-ligase, partial [Actinomycetota bacterium]
AWPPLHGTVLSYLAMDDEVSLAATHELDRCRIAVTRTPPEGPLSVHLLEDGLLEEHRLGFLQPSPKSPEVSLDEVEVVLVPGLAFDHSGNRLGRGKGYYDGLLSSLPAGVVRVGVTVDELIVDVLPTEEHDERVAWIATESGIRRAGDPLPEATNRFVSSAVLAGVAPEIHRFPEGTKTSADAAAAVGAELGEIAKSILFSVDGEPVLVICSGDRRINESLLADSLGASHVRIADLDEVRGWTGYVAGGTPGVGLSPEVRVVADSSLARYRWVWSAGGTPDTVYPISLARLVGASGARWVDVSDRGKT